VDIIAHRGASGYLPEHTLPAKAMAHAMGATYLEQDLVASSDGHLLVLHDIHIDRVTDVADRFPTRARGDGRFYALDFTLEELRTLTVHERVDANGNAVYPCRFPVQHGPFRMNTLDEEIAFIEGLNRSTGRQVGLYTEIKRPAWHRAQGVDLTVLTLEALARRGYTERDDAVWLQCFDADELTRLREDLDCRLKLVQLIAQNDWQESPTDYDALCTEAGLAERLKVVDAFGPWIPQLIDNRSTASLVPSSFAKRLMACGLPVHPYTLRVDDLPSGVENFDELVRFLAFELSVSGVFADQPDRVLQVLR